MRWWRRRAGISCSRRISSTACLARFKLEGRVVATATGAALELIRFRHPLYDRASPVYLGTYVTLEQGTGVVHSSPAYGIEDFQSCRRYGMTDDEILNPGRRRRPLRRQPAVLRRREDLGSQSADRRQAARRRRAVLGGEVHAQLHALLAAPHAGDLPRDDAVVRRHGRRSGLERQEAGTDAARNGPRRHRGDAVLSRAGARRASTA